MNRRGFLGMFSRAPLAVPLLATSALAVQTERVLGTPRIPPVRTVSADDVFRDYNESANPASGRHLPSKNDIRRLFAELEAAIEYRSG